MARLALRSGDSVWLVSSASKELPHSKLFASCACPQQSRGLWSVEHVPGQKNQEDGGQNDSQCSDNGDRRSLIHCFCPQGTIASQPLSGQRKPLRLPSKLLVLINLRSIQNSLPHSGHVSLKRRCICSKRENRPTDSPCSIRRLNATIPAGPRMKT